MILSIALLVSTLMCVVTNVLVLRAFYGLVHRKQNKTQNKPLNK